MLDVCVTHKFCLDGLASAWVFKRSKINKPSMVFYSSARMEWELYGLPKIIERKSELGTVFFIDMNPSLTVMHDLASNGIAFEVLDHHEEEFDKTLKLATKEGIDLTGKTMFDNSECGATLAWKRFFPNLPLLSFLDHIRKNDTWTHASDEDRYVSEYIKTYLPNNSSIDDVNTFIANFSEQEATRIGKTIYQKTMIEVKNATRAIIMVDFEGTQVAVANESVNPSLVGHELARRAPGGLGMAFYVSPERGMVKAAVRGDGASTFCRKFGGGGHKQAAGFEMGLSEFAQFLKSAKKFKEK